MSRYTSRSQMRTAVQRSYSSGGGIGGGNDTTLYGAGTVLFAASAIFVSFFISSFIPVLFLLQNVTFHSIVY